MQSYALPPSGFAKRLLYLSAHTIKRSVPLLIQYPARLYSLNGVPAAPCMKYRSVLELFRTENGSTGPITVRFFVDFPVNTSGIRSPTRLYAATSKSMYFTVLLELLRKQSSVETNPAESIDMRKSINSTFAFGPAAFAGNVTIKHKIIQIKIEKIFRFMILLLSKLTSHWL